MAEDTSPPQHFYSLVIDISNDFLVRLYFAIYPMWQCLLLETKQTLCQSAKPLLNVFLIFNWQQCNVVIEAMGKDNISNRASDGLMWWTGLVCGRYSSAMLLFFGRWRGEHGIGAFEEFFKPPVLATKASLPLKLSTKILAYCRAAAIEVMDPLDLWPCRATEGFPRTSSKC